MAAKDTVRNSTDLQSLSIREGQPHRRHSLRGDRGLQETDHSTVAVLAVHTAHVLVLILLDAVRGRHIGGDELNGLGFKKRAKV